MHLFVCVCMCAVVSVGIWVFIDTLSNRIITLYIDTYINCNVHIVGLSLCA
jgi:hypothetical protein